MRTIETGWVSVWRRTSITIMTRVHQRITCGKSSYTTCTPQSRNKTHTTSRSMYTAYCLTFRMHISNTAYNFKWFPSCHRTFLSIVFHNVSYLSISWPHIHINTHHKHTLWPHSICIFNADNTFPHNSSITCIIYSNIWCYCSSNDSNNNLRWYCSCMLK